ncbi:glycosyl hydrolase-like protein [Leptomonas pyrrhocoris]|uniref:Glycosyl hydrolase-like protein n=1 Tax=Leptomonas pyrrhocoris TaxID=157538 RepID=A0A0N0DVZ2_LEPPY|nr:glycosyl hydrolase-like protein [Leptomonas pyrrhocoris]KPA81084.1 glycosyl hydrolase-like protein [Leptomonas pyrrhocoris]|eukprot:XP_015659523.1 glycosyl hydrolase-like protein [Leptomonas pyrrhocoris]
MPSSSSLSTVSLYRYDLTQGMARNFGPMLLGRPIEGIWHTSVVVFGREYYFDGGVGIVADPNPGRTRFGAPHRTEALGETAKRYEEFFAWTQRQRTSGFGPGDYHLLNNNCNSFTDAASVFLLGRHIPRDVLEMIPTLLSSPVGQMLRPMLEQATSGGAGGVAEQAVPLTQPPPPPFSFSSPSSATAAATAAAAAPAHTDTCVGLLSPHQTVTESDEEDLMLAQAMLESNETIADGSRSPPEAFEKAISGLTLLRTALANICEHPTEAKYRALSTESNAYKTKLKPLELYGVADVLRIAGFVRRPHSNGNGGEQWFLSDAAGNAALLERVGEMLAVTISSIEGAADDAAKERVKSTADATAPNSSVSVNEEAQAQGGFLKAPPPPRSSATASPALRYCYPPFPKDWTPLSVGWEGGAPLFSIHCLHSSSNGGAEGPYCFGKCRLSPNQQLLQAYYCSSDGREVEIRGGYEVLCVQRGQESSVTWVPARMASATAAATPSTPPRFIFCGYGRFGVARAEHGSGVHPGVMEPSGRCVIPYGGHAVVVTDTAEVLCENAQLPPTLMQALRALETGARLSKLLRAASGRPIGSFDELLHQWQPPVFYVKPQLLRSRSRLAASAVDWDGGYPPSQAATEAADGDRHTSQGTPTSPFAKSATSPTRLLVCHDFGGGYTAGERHLYVLEERESAAMDRNVHTKTCTPNKRIPAVESAYTVSYWDRTDCFVYFSHQRISVPPREWIHDGHRHGVAVLGTIITEGADGAADLEVLLSDAKRMAAIIVRLVEVCDAYGFDGYLLNVENSLPPTMAKRLVIFCTQLRKQLNRKTSQGTARLVIWYDAMTIDGSLAYQNALTARNKPFFDVCDGLFTNYFWNPVHVALTRTTAGPRGADVYVGVDVFGRHMFGGGGYNTYVAVEEAAHAGLSVALFAPGWTMEYESKGTRDGFASAESRLWSRLQDKFAYHVPLLSWGQRKGGGALGRAWTAFQSGVGYDFHVNGRRVTEAGSRCTTGAWCELSAAHAHPPFLYEAPPSSASASSTAGGAHADLVSALGLDVEKAGAFAALPLRLPASSLQRSMYGGTVRAVWRYDKAWFGDRCLCCLIQSMEAAEVLRWYVQNALPAAAASAPHEENEGTWTSAPSSPSLHIELMLEEAEVSAAAVMGGGRATKGPGSTQRGLRVGLYSASRGAFHAVVWEKTSLQTSASPVAVAGLEGVLVRVTSTHSNATASSFSDEWCRVHYELHNTSNENLHLTSVAVVNGDASRTMQLCVGAVAVYQTPVPAGKAENADGAESDVSVLCAAGPHVWAEHTTYATGKDSEQVLSLSSAGDVFADVRQQHGVRSTVVLFASINSSVAPVEAADEEEEGKVLAAAASGSVRSDGHHMYLGQYSVDPADETTYNGSLLVPLSLPADSAVAQVYYYVVPNGY